jgi:hypothetical protein
MGESPKSGALGGMTFGQALGLLENSLTSRYNRNKRASLYLKFVNYNCKKIV